MGQVAAKFFDRYMVEEGQRLDQEWAELVDKGKRGPARQTHARSRTITADMREEYESGLSLAQVASRYGCTRQSVYDRFKRAGVKMRTVKRNPVVRFRGLRYTAAKDGYYRCTTGGRVQLVHAVWAVHHGPVPPGHEILNKGPAWTKDVEDLLLISRRDRSHLAGAVDQRWCEYCGFLIPHKKYRPKAYSERRFCSPRCKGLAGKGAR